jgi:hypothetical protein
MIEKYGFKTPEEVFEKMRAYILEETPIEKEIKWLKKAS